MRHHALALVALAAASSAVSAQTISYTGATYTQNFDGLASNVAGTTQAGRGPFALATGLPGSTGVSGWYAGNIGGSSPNSEFRSQDGSLSSSAGRGVISYGASASGERALGVLTTSNQIPRFGALFTNNTGTVLTAVTITFTGEQWRRGDVATPDVLQFVYGFASDISVVTTRVAALDFASVNTSTTATNIALNGNDPANQRLVSATISGINWAAGTTLAIAWDATELTGQDDGLSVDNFSLSAVPTPGSAALLGLAGLAGLRRRR